VIAMQDSAKVRMPGAVILALVMVTGHALGYVFGGWAVIDENRSKLEHGQDLLMPMAMAWFVALFLWGLAALQVACVLQARKRRLWVRVVLIVCLSFAALSMAFAFLASLATGVPAPPAFLIAALDVAALWMVSGEKGRDYFSARGPASGVITA
jgi:glucan phosphoethanolaminetransferase (alkaline phosphatase superfamily)